MKTWILDPTAKCASVFYQDSAGDIQDARTDAAQEKLLFTLVNSGNSQIFLREFPAWPMACLPLTELGSSGSAKSVADPAAHPKTRSDSAASEPSVGRPPDLW